MFELKNGETQAFTNNKLFEFKTFGVKIIMFIEWR